jgi:hypothetical protein
MKNETLIRCKRWLSSAGGPVGNGRPLRDGG